MRAVYGFGHICIFAILIFALLVGCRAPAPVHESDVTRACEGVTVWATTAGDVVQLTFAEAATNRARVLRFEGGALRLDLSGAVEAGTPRLDEVAPGRWCARGDVESDACIEAWWARGACVEVGR